MIVSVIMRAGMVCAMLVGLVSIPIPSPAQTTPSEFESTVRYLSSDELEGRRTGQRGNLLAAGFIAGAFAEAGLEPLGGEYFHDFDYVSSAAAGSDLKLVLHYDEGSAAGADGGSTFSRELVAGKDFSVLGFSSEGSYEGGLVFAGYGISAPDAKYDDYAGIDVTDKIVVIYRYAPESDNPHDPLGEHASFVRKVMTAREKGAAALLIVDMRDDAGLIPLFFNRNFADVGIGVGTLDRFEALTLRHPDGRNLAELKEEIDQLREPRSFPLVEWRAEFTADLEFDRRSVPNIVGVLPGNDPSVADEMIVVGGHFDHLGHGGQGSLYRGGDRQIHNGADDNASGTTAVISLARRWAERGGNRRTMVFMAFNGEEEGLLGSAALLEQGVLDPQKIVAMINLDMVGRMDDREIVAQGYGTSNAWKEIVPAANTDGLSIKEVPDGFGPSDHSSFYAKKIPVLFFFTGLHDNYHRPSDDWDLLNYDGLASVADLVDRVLGGIDRRAEAPDYIDVPRPAQAGNTRFRVILGVIPDYGWGGEGLRIVSVASGGPADEAGILGGDVIVGMAGERIANINEYTVVLAKVEPGSEIDVVISRDGAEQTLKVKPKSR